MSSEVYDVAIVGGGLAGLCLAIQCVDDGRSVVLFEKEEYPFHKVCGEYVSLESYDFLNGLGVQLDRLQLPIINSLQISDTTGHLYNFPLSLGGFGISRYILDNTLYKIAINRGVIVNTSTKVSDIKFANNQFNVLANNIQVHARVVAGCFGKRSNIDVKWNRSFVQKKANALNNYIGVKYHIRYEQDPSLISLHNFNNGYCGISKIEDGKSCLCYLTTAQNLRQCSNSIEELQKQILYKNKRLANVFENATFLYQQPLTISQISFQKKTQSQDHVLLLGDAAGMISPLCGNGMSMAMHASKIALKHIKFYLESKISRNKMESHFSIDWQNEFSKRLKIGRTVQRFFGGELSTSLFLKTMHTLPWLAKQIINSTHGKPF